MPNGGAELACLRQTLPFAPIKNSGVELDALNCLENPRNGDLTVTTRAKKSADGAPGTPRGVPPKRATSPISRGFQRETEKK